MSKEKKGRPFFDGCADERRRRAAKENGRRGDVSSLLRGVAVIGDREKTSSSQHGHATHRLRMCALAQEKGEGKRKKTVKRKSEEEQREKRMLFESR